MAMLIVSIAVMAAVVSQIGVGAGFCAFTLQVKRKIGPKPNGAIPVQLIASDKARLQAWWFEAKVPNGGCVVVLHGILDSKVSSSGFAPLFLAQGYSVLTPDSRAH